MLVNFNPHFRKGSDSTSSLQWLQPENFNPHFRKGSDSNFITKSINHFLFQSTLPQGKWRCCRPRFRNGLLRFQSTLPQGKWQVRTAAFSCSIIFQSTLPQGKWLQYSTKTSVYFYEISINIFEFTFVYYWNTLSIQKAHSNLFIFTGASLPVILCMLDTRTCKL